MVSISIDWMDLVVSVHDTLFCCIWNSGIIPSLAGVSHVAIQFPAYEKIKSFMAKKGNVKCLLLCWFVLQDCSVFYNYQLVLIVWNSNFQITQLLIS